MSSLAPDTRALLARARGARPARSSRSRIDARFALQLGAAAAVAAAPAALAPAATAALTPTALAPAAAPVAAAVGGGAFGLKGALLAAVLVVGGGVVIGSTATAPDRARPSATTTEGGTVAASTSAIPDERAAGVRERVRDGSEGEPSPARAAVEPAASASSAAFVPRVTSAPIGSPASGASSGPSSGSVSSGGLGRDSALMAEALRSLRHGDPDAALRSLDALGSAQPNGALAEERVAARVLALCAAGRTEDAKAAAADFLSRFPGSVQANQVRASCAR